MVDTAIASATGTQTEPRGPAASDAATIAASIVERAQTGTGDFDFSQMRRDVSAVEAFDPRLGTQVRQMVEGRLTPVQRGELARAEYTLLAQGRPVTFSDDGMTVAQQFASPSRSAAREQYDYLDALYGDGNLATFDGPAIENGLRSMQGGHAQFDLGLMESGFPTASVTTAQVSVETSDVPAAIADLTQMGIDLVGIVDPTGIADGANAVISLGRAGLAIWTGNGGEALGHLGNGALSAISVLPLGDLAKAGKIGRWADTISSAIRGAADNPAMREAVTPLLREIAQNLNRIPQGALDSLPQSARESLERMKTQLNEFFGAAARQVDGAVGAVFGSANIGRQIRVNGQDVAIGAAPDVARRADGAPQATNINGDTVTINQPRTYDTRTVNPDGSVTYSRNGQAVNYDADGFPVFNSRADVYLPPDRIVVGSRDTHFTAANRVLAENSDAQLRSTGFTDAEIGQIRQGETPDNYTWHHHQDVGRMQLVRTNEHDALRGGHTGGWALWGDSGRFTVE